RRHDRPGRRLRRHRRHDRRQWRAPPELRRRDMNDSILMGTYVFLLALFLGVVLIGRVPSTLHTPLMSATNAISGIVILGGMTLMAQVDNGVLMGVGFIAVALGAANVVGGFAVTDRMLAMFKRRPDSGTGGEAGS